MIEAGVDEGLHVSLHGEGGQVRIGGRVALVKHPLTVTSGQLLQRAAKLNHNIIPIYSSLGAMIGVSDNESPLFTRSHTQPSRSYGLSLPSQVERLSRIVSLCLDIYLYFSFQLLLHVHTPFLSLHAISKA